MAQRRIDRKINMENGTVTFTVLADGGQLVCEMEKVAPGYDKLPNIAQKLLFHAVNAKVGDSAADPKMENPLAAMNTTWDQLVSGEWTNRGGGSGSGPRVTIVDRGVAAYKKISVEEAIVAINAAAEKKGVEPKEIRRGLAKNEHIAAEIAKIKADNMKVKAKEAQKAAAASEPVELEL